MNRAQERAKAASLKALLVSELLAPTLPLVQQKLTPAQGDQIQQALDAYAVNPAVDKEAKVYFDKAVIARSGNYVNRDPDIMQKGYDVQERGKIVAKLGWNRTKIDAILLLEAGALATQSDNPDEAKFWTRVSKVLTQWGVWLRIEQKMLRDPNDLNVQVFDPRQFDVWLSLGPNGPAIPTDTGAADPRLHSRQQDAWGLLLDGT